MGGRQEGPLQKVWALLQAKLCALLGDTHLKAKPGKPSLGFFCSLQNAVLAYLQQVCPSGNFSICEQGLDLHATELAEWPLGPAPRLFFPELSAYSPPSSISPSPLPLSSRPHTGLVIVS